jgi:mRNA interferase HigB
MAVVWVGTHQEYEMTFKNDKNTIKKWLNSNDWL